MSSSASSTSVRRKRRDARPAGRIRPAGRPSTDPSRAWRGRVSFLFATREFRIAPADENMFRQLRLNQRVKQSVRWMPMDK